MTTHFLQAWRRALDTLFILYGRLSIVLTSQSMLAPRTRPQALLMRLLAPDPKRRPKSMTDVLSHPFFKSDGTFEAPPLTGDDLNHLFLSHFQGNAVRAAARSSNHLLASGRGHTCC